VRDRGRVIEVIVVLVRPVGVVRFLGADHQTPWPVAVPGAAPHEIDLFGIKVIGLAGLFRPVEYNIQP
jgi:hypothetical protein